MQKIPLFGTGVGKKSSNVSAQGRLNVYAEQLAEPDKTAMALYGRPGLIRYSVSGGISGAATSGGLFKPGVIIGPIRALDVNYVAGQTAPSSVYGVVGNVTFQIVNNVWFYNWLYLTSTPLGTSTGAVSMVNDGINIGIADGQAGYYAPSGTPSSLQPITDVDFPQNTPSMTVIASRTVCVDPAFVGRFRWSAAGDITSWDPLDFATAESSGDSLTAVFEANGELLLFGAETLEFWGATGDIRIFSRIGSSGAQWGTQKIQTIKKVGNRVMFLGRSQTGTESVCLLDGYTPRVVSTPDVDADIKALASATATACVVTWQGHTFYLLNLATKTWAYDLRDGTWSVWQSGSTRFLGEHQTQFGSYSFVSSYVDNTLYYLDDVYSDDGTLMIREVTSRHVSQNTDRAACYEVVIDCETGVGLSDGVSQGWDPQLMLQISKDGGHTWGYERWQSLGKVGEYRKRLIWRQNGNARDWLFKLRVTDPVKLVILGAYGTFDG